MTGQNTTSKPAPAASGEGDAKLAVIPAQQKSAEKPAAVSAKPQPAAKPAAPQKPTAPANPAKQPAPKPRPAALPPVRPTAKKARLQRRHIGLAVSFLLFVLLPVIVSSWYLWARAEDQYASYLGFSVRSESGTTSSEVLGGLTSLVGVGDSSSTDTDILYKFIQSHDLVQRVDARLNLRQIWSKAPDDPIFSYTGNSSLEDLLGEWERKVRIYYDNGMIDLRVLAFEPKDAQAISQAIYEESTILINQLNDIAREDTLRYSRDELDAALARLKEARQAMTEFRNRHQMVDPTADVQGQVGVVTSLQQQLAEALVQLGLLQSNAQPGDPRIEQSELRIRVIREQIADERKKFGSETATGEALSAVVGQYESLAVDREFAERSYTAALAAHETARMEASRQSRYLAAYVKPTLAQEAEYPARGKLLLIIGSFLLIIWIIGILMFYSLRDRR
jgi:capsular polysaccharide transport system permease protein